jgi:hypothetical protein
MWLYVNSFRVCVCGYLSGRDYVIYMRNPIYDGFAQCDVWPIITEIHVLGNCSHCCMEQTVLTLQLHVRVLDLND